MIRAWHAACSRGGHAERIARDTTEGFQMFCTKRSLVQFAAVLVALAANACAAPGGRPVVSAASANVACVGGVIRTESDAELYSRCGSVTGDLSIVGSELTELSALSGLQRVSGKLEIAGNSALDDLSGLERLEQVGTLSIRDNADLDDLSGLQNLRRVGSVVVSGNPELASLRGLQGLTRVDTLVLEHNGLYQTAGLSNLAEVGRLVIADNLKLNSAQGLRSLSRARSIDRDSEQPAPVRPRDAAGAEACRG
jgi:hypothetical protein